ncbi:MAG: hypothetical protein JWN86_3953 [Planctomycetota bacterium]|nr:hypothetical protein [Planctomycetota bacterium]
MTGEVLIVEADPRGDFTPYAIGIAAAAAAGLLASGLAAVLGRKRESATGLRWGPTVGIGVGFLLGQAMILGWLTRPQLLDAKSALMAWRSDGGAFPLFPGEAAHWMPWLGGAALLFGLLEGWKPAPGWARWENRLGLTALTLWLLLGNRFGGSWEPTEGTMWLLGLGLAMLVFWSVIDRRAERLGPSMPLVLMMMASALSISLYLSFMIFGCLFAAALAATLGGVWVVSWFDPKMNLARGAIAVFVVLYVGLLVCYLFYSDLPRISVLALALAPLATYVDRVGPVSRLSGWKSAAIRIGVLIVPLAVAIGAAFAARNAMM